MKRSVAREFCLPLVLSLTVLGSVACGDDAESEAPVDEDGGTHDGGDGDDAAIAMDAGGDGDAELDEMDEDAGELEPPDALSVRELCEVLIEQGRRVLCGANEVECEAALEGGEARCEALVAAVEQGRLSFDGVAAHACVEGQTEDQLAEAFAGLYFNCTGAFTGRVEEGEDCYFDYGFTSEECAPGLYCAQTSMCPGECRPYQQEGDACPSAGRCDPELTCVRECELPCEGTCGARPGVGEGCENTSGVCAAGLICDASSEPYVCIEPRAEGEPCTRSYQCATFYCIDEECATAAELECRGHMDCDDDQYCDQAEQRCAPRIAEDESCAGGALCADGLECHYRMDDGGEFCRARAGIDGEPCLPWGCEEDHYCADEDGVLTCRPDRGMGESCGDEDMSLGIGNASCEPGLHCMHSNTLTCLPPGGLDEPCYYNNTESCEAGLVCSGFALSTCQPPSDLGERCSPAFENACSEGICECMMIDDSCDWFCIATLDLGEPCDDPRDCTSGYCDIALTEPVCAVDPGAPSACLPPDR
jgi:hypothetical protein